MINEEICKRCPEYRTIIKETYWWWCNKIIYGRISPNCPLPDGCVMMMEQTMCKWQKGEPTKKEMEKKKICEKCLKHKSHKYKDYMICWWCDKTEGYITDMPDARCLSNKKRG